MSEMTLDQAIHSARNLAIGPDSLLSKCLDVIEEHLAQPVQAVDAWMTEDGRVISDRQKATAIKDGGASASSVAPYSIPLTRALSGEKAGRVGGYAALREYVAELPHPVLVAKAHEHIGCARWPDLIAYHHAISGEGEHAYTWKDKPHRLVYNLTRELAYLRNLVCDSLPVSPAPSKEG